MDLNYVNPHFFTAILDNVPHRFVLIQECECREDFQGFQPPRFSVGASQATQDPRNASLRELVSVGVNLTALAIPRAWLMAHQYLYIVHENTDRFGWQYRTNWLSGEDASSWHNEFLPQHNIRRRVWMTTIVPRLELVRCKRLLAENVHVDQGFVKMQGELFRYEKGTLTKSWNRRRVVLHHNRIEFFSNSSKKGEISLQDCEVRMLSPEQCPIRGSAGEREREREKDKGKERESGKRHFPFSIRSSTGSVGILLDTDDAALRRQWVLAIQYQLAMNADEMNFAPLDYAPPAGAGHSAPDSRVMLAADLHMLSKDGKTYVPRHFQLLPREIVCFDEHDALQGRIFVEQATVSTDEEEPQGQGQGQGEEEQGTHTQTRHTEQEEKEKERESRFRIHSASGISLSLAARSREATLQWVEGVRAQVKTIENQKLRLKTTPKEELQENGLSPSERLSLYRDGGWTAPPVEGESDEYLQSLYCSALRNDPEHFEFSADLEISLDPRLVTSSTASRTPRERDRERERERAMSVTVENNTNTTVDNTSQPAHTNPSPTSSSTHTSHTTLTATHTTTTNTTHTLTLGAGARSSSKQLDPRRLVINPRVMLACLKSINHRFLLVLECEFRDDAPQIVTALSPPRFAVGGARASKDPRTVPLDQLLEISNVNPEIQLPGGWFMLHPYIYIVQQNTDDNGWQYRSTWSEGNPLPGEEPWADASDAARFVRRRMWMTTVVKRDDVLRAKRLVADWLHKPRDDNAIFTDASLRVLRLAPDEEITTLSPAALNNARWETCKALLYHRKLEFYNGHDKAGEALLADCEVLLVSRETCGRDHVLALLHPGGVSGVSSNAPRLLLQCESESAAARLLHAIAYQLLLLAPDLNFEPITFSPPTGALPEQRVLFCGDLRVCADTSMHTMSGVSGGSVSSKSKASDRNGGNGVGQWELLSMQLTEDALRFFRRDGSLYGQLLIDGAALRSREDDCEFTLRTQSGHQVYLRAEDADARQSWVQQLRRAAELCRLRRRTVSRSLSPRERAGQFRDAHWLARESDGAAAAEDELFLCEARERLQAELVTRWPFTPLASPTGAMSRQNSATIAASVAAEKEKEREREREKERETALSQSSSSQKASKRDAISRFCEDDEISDADFDIAPSAAAAPSRLLALSRQSGVAEQAQTTPRLFSSSTAGSALTVTTTTTTATTVMRPLDLAIVRENDAPRFPSAKSSSAGSLFNADEKESESERERESESDDKQSEKADESLDEFDAPSPRARDKPADVVLRKSRSADRAERESGPTLLPTVALRPVMRSQSTEEREKLPVKVQLRPINVKEWTELRDEKEREREREKPKSPMHQVALKPVLRRESEERISSPADEEKDRELQSKEKERMKVNPLDRSRFDIFEKKESERPPSWTRPSSSGSAPPAVSADEQGKKPAGDNLSFQQKLLMFAQKAKTQQAPVFPNNNVNSKRLSFPKKT